MSAFIPQTDLPSPTAPPETHDAISSVVAAAPSETLPAPWGPIRGRLSIVPEKFVQHFAPATHCLYEWTDYRIECPGADQMLVGTQMLEPEFPGCFIVRFGNHLGLAAIQPFARGRPLCPPWQVEVLSRKFPTPKTHLRFFSTLLKELFERAASLPFTISSMTRRSVVETLRPPTPLFMLHFLNQYGLQLTTALTTIRRSPHRQLVDHPDHVPLPEANAIDADVLLRLVYGNFQAKDSVLPMWVVVLIVFMCARLHAQ